MVYILESPVLAHRVMCNSSRGINVYIVGSRDEPIYFFNRYISFSINSNGVCVTLRTKMCVAVHEIGLGFSFERFWGIIWFEKNCWLLKI